MPTACTDAATTPQARTSYSSTETSASPSTSAISASAASRPPRRLGFIGDAIAEDEAEDLINLVVNGEVTDPASALGEHVNECWPELVGPSDRSLVHWLRRLIFRSAWLDQRVKEGELDVVFDDDTGAFVYIQPDRGGEPIELAPEPSWGRVAYVRR